MSSHGSDAGDEEDEVAIKKEKTSHVLGSNTSTNTHAFILCGLIMLSFDGLNPVKRVCLLVYDTDDASAVGWLFIVLLVCAVLQDFANVCFYGARIFLNAIMSISISKVDVIGTEHIPTNGPVILVANHQNQFVDGMCIVCSCQQRKLSFMVARKSYNHPLIGLFARVMASVPVARPQDMAFGGSGKLLQLTPVEEEEVEEAEEEEKRADDARRAEAADGKVAASGAAARALRRAERHRAFMVRAKLRGHAKAAHLTPRATTRACEPAGRASGTRRNGSGRGEHGGVGGGDGGGSGGEGGARAIGGCGTEPASTDGGGR